MLAPWILSYSEQREFLQQLWGAMTFSANFVLWRQTGYFAASAQLKPLLHTWSLSIEEQYYLRMPALLAIVPKKMWFGLIALFTVISLSTYLLMFEARPGSVFYFTPARILWLGIGSILPLALIKRDYLIPNWCRSLVAPVALIAGTLAVFLHHQILRQVSSI
ncbi:MAG: peptidoglycan/LPS O-acetylase OafA/YrhL [Arenicella sp.]